jgi:hypothetical protein
MEGINALCLNLIMHAHLVSARGVPVVEPFSTWRGWRSAGRRLTPLMTGLQPQILVGSMYVRSHEHDEQRFR